MSRYDFHAHRLFVDVPLEAGGVVPLDLDRANRLVAVLRLRDGDPVLVFNGRDGEWRASLSIEGRRRVVLAIGARVRPQAAPGDLHYIFAPLKHARLDYMAQKAVEMGASRLVPVFTRRTQPQRVNLPRLRANVIEAAEQCGILAIPDVAEPVTLERLTSAWPAQRTLVFCDEDAETAGPCAALAAARAAAAPLAVLVGPEGGFADDERRALMGLPAVIRLSLGPRILRADTAAVAALALVQATLGDWH